MTLRRYPTTPTKIKDAGGSSWRNGTATYNSPSLVEMNSFFVCHQQEAIVADVSPRDPSMTMKTAEIQGANEQRPEGFLIIVLIDGRQHWR